MASSTAGPCDVGWAAAARPHPLAPRRARLSVHLTPAIFCKELPAIYWARRPAPAAGPVLHGLGNRTSWARAERAHLWQVCHSRQEGMGAWCLQPQKQKALDGHRERQSWKGPWGLQSPPPCAPAQPRGLVTRAKLTQQAPWSLGCATNFGSISAFIGVGTERCLVAAGRHHGLEKGSCSWSTQAQLCGP